MHIQSKLFLLICTLLAIDCEAQQVRINGSTGNRPLTWDDFTGKPDKHSSWYAYTAWNLPYQFTGVAFKGDTAILKGLTFDLELDPRKSWLKKGNETAALLNHEQGHFNIALLLQKELVEGSQKITFFRNGYITRLTEFYGDLHKKYTLLNEKYDEETRHSQDMEQQAKWDLFFKQQL
jgi:hypothetical protein